jgi:hypothetical protein
MSERIEYFKKRSPRFCNSSKEFFINVINQVKNTFKEDNYSGIIILLCILLRYDFLNNEEISDITTYFLHLERNKTSSNFYEKFEFFCDQSATKYVLLKQSCGDESLDIPYLKYRSDTFQYASVPDFNGFIGLVKYVFKKNKYEGVIRLLCILLSEDILDNTEILKITEYFLFTKIHMRNSNFCDNFAVYCDQARTKFEKLKMESMQSL